MKVVVTGATGFIGSHVITRLAEEAIALRAVSHRHLCCWPSDNVQAIRSDLRDPSCADAILSGSDVVVHLAGLAHVCADADDYQQVNVRATVNLAEAAIRNEVRALVFASSVSVYGKHGDCPMTETSLCRPITEYGKSKAQAEDALAKLAAGSGLSVIVLRLSTAYGDQDPGNVSRLIKSVQRFGPTVIGRGTNLKSLTHVDNIAELIASLIGRKLGGFDVVNVGDPAPYSLSTIVDTVADITGSKRPALRVPLSMAMTGAGLMELACGAIGRKPPVSRDQVTKLTESAVVDVTHLRDGYGFTSKILLREGIRRTLGLV